MAGERRWSDRNARPSGCAWVLLAATGVTLAWCRVATEMTGYLTWDWWPL